MNHLHQNVECPKCGQFLDYNHAEIMGYGPTFIVELNYICRNEKCDTNKGTSKDGGQ